MQLKSIELKGFKSFQNKTSILFPGDGQVSIVGPNGSGKSNLLDAFRWVLGEQSAKNLRGEKMEDIIFSGTQYKKPMNVCEVEIIFDNSDRSLNIEYDEVSIRRKAYRSGESTYYLNNRSCRLKDVRELLMDSGIGREGYSIISQGKVDEIVNGSSSERRKIFEEACGITRYRYKKDENQRKLEKVKENLERIEDIYTEIERTVLPLEKEKKKAEQYFELKKELKVCELNLILKETGGLLEKLNKDACEAEEAEKLRLAIEEEQEKNYDEQQEYAERIRQREHLMRTIEQEIKTLFERQMETDAKIVRGRDVIQSIHDQEAYRIKEEEHLKQEIDRLEEERVRQSDLLLEKKTLQEESAAALLQAQKEQASSEQASLELNDLLEDCRSRYARMKEDYTSLQTKLSLLLEQKQQEEEKNAESAGRCEELGQQIGELNSALNGYKAEKARLEEEKRLAQQKHLKLLEGYQSLLSEEKEVGESCQRIEIELKTLESKLKMMYELENDFEGLPKTVKDLMKNSRIAGLRNVVANLIDMEERYEVAIEAALGAAINNVVVTDSQAAKEAIAYLKRHKLGKVTMLPLANIRGNRPVLKGEIFAAEVVRTQEEYRVVADYLLGRTVLCDTIDDAIRISKKYNYLYRVVTLEGDIFNAGGSVTGGYRGQRNNLLSNKRIRREQEERRRQCAEALKERRKQREDLLRSKEEAEAELSQSEQDNTSLRRSLEETEMLIHRKKQEINFLRLRLDDLEKSRRLAEEKKEELDQRREEYLCEQGELEQRLEELEGELGELEGKRREDDIERQARIGHLEELRLTLVSLEKETEGIQNALKIQQDTVRAMYRRSQERQGQQEADAKRLEELQAQISDLTRDLEELRSKKTEQEKYLNAQKELVEKDRQESLRLEARRKELDSDRLEQMQKTFELEKKLGKNRLIVEHYNTKLQEEYFLTLEEIEDYRDEKANTKKTHIQELRKKIDSLGNVNLNAIEQYKEAKERFDFYREQKDDLTEAMVTTEKIISDLKNTMALEFKEEFHKINECFKHTFQALFGEGGSAELLLADEADLLNTEIEIKAQPPGKRLKSISAMSGGEKALTAIGILFAILSRRPTPFCYLDEIDASLDEINVQRFNSFLQHMSQDTQFVTITHRRGTMKSSKYIYGVTMEEKGISKVISMELAEAGRFIEE